MKRLTVNILSISILFNTAACGTLLYPERQGQTDGEFDMQIMAYNAVGLLFFIIPGVLAFAIDYSNGTLFLPEDDSVQLTQQELDTLSAQGKVDLQALNTLLKKKHYISLNMTQHSTHILPLGSQKELHTLFAKHYALSTFIPIKYSML